MGPHCTKALSDSGRPALADRLPPKQPTPALWPSQVDVKANAATEDHRQQRQRHHTAIAPLTGTTAKRIAELAPIPTLTASACCSLYARFSQQGPNTGRNFYNCARRGGQRCSSFTWAEKKPAAAAVTSSAATTSSAAASATTSRIGGGGTSVAAGTRWRSGDGGDPARGRLCKGHQQPCQLLITKKEVQFSVTLCSRYVLDAVSYDMTAKLQLQTGVL